MVKTGQNYGNHRQWNTFHHFVVYGFLVVCLAHSLTYAFSEHGNFMLGMMFTLFTVTVTLVHFNARIMVLRAQDRAIRAEENLRYFALTGKRYSPNLRLGQVIALRFAPDEELVALAKRAEDENLKPDQIKQAIKNWKGDYYRV
jgi:hypothetical protein